MYAQRTRSMFRMMRFSIMTGLRSIHPSAASMMVRIVATDSTGYLIRRGAVNIESLRRLLYRSTKPHPTQLTTQHTTQHLLPLRRLPREHHRVRAVVHRVRHVRHLRARRAGLNLIYSCG